MAACRPLLFLSLALLAAATPCAARGSGLPTAPLQQSFEAARAAGVERSEPLARALLVTAARAPEDRRSTLLPMISQADPTLVAPHLLAARHAARHFDVAGVCAALGAGLSAMRLDARTEAVSCRRGVHAAHLLLAATLATLALLLALRALPLARHSLGERLGSYTAATLLLAVPLLAALVVSPALGSLVVLGALGTFMRRRERACMAVLCALLAAVEFVLPRLAAHALLLDPRSRSAQIERLNAGGPDSELEARLAAQRAHTPEMDLVLGLQARRRGDFATAGERYAACLRGDSTCAAAYVDLSNLCFHAGQFERAATGYRVAQVLDPTSPLPHANLAQTYIRLLHYGESDAEQRAAAARGMSAIERRRALWHDDECPVLDMTLSKAEILRLAADESARDPEARVTALQAWRSRPWQSVRLGVAPWALLAIAALLLSPLRLRRVTIACTGCGTIVCAHCASADAGPALCNGCLLAQRLAAPRAAAIEPEEEADAPPPPPPRRRVSLAAGRWMAPLFPGAADVARGAPVAAMFTVTAAWAALLVAAALVGAARLRALPWYVTVDAPLLRIALGSFFLLWLPGLLRLRSRAPRARTIVRPSAAGA